MSEICNVETSLTRLASSLSVVRGPYSPVRNVAIEDDLFSDEPKISYYRAEATNHNGRLGSQGLAAGGRDVSDLGIARARAVLEAMERRACADYRDSNLIWATFRDLSNRQTNALDPAQLVDARLGSQDRQRVQDYRLAWTSATDTVLGSEILVPAQLVYTPYRFRHHEPQLRDPITTGAAAGMSIKAAHRRGINEVRERHEIMKLHFTRRPMGRSDEAISAESSSVNWLMNAAQDYGLELRLYELTESPATVVALLADRSGVGPLTVVGSATDDSSSNAAISAALEAFTFRRQIRRRIIETSIGSRPHVESLVNLEQRAMYWAFTDSSELEYLLPHQHRQTDPRPATPIEDKRMFLANLTPRRSPFGVKVTKTIIPEMQGMHMDEASLTVSQSLLELPDWDVRDLSSQPHPFL